jgi:hypothetical protein
MPQRSDVLLGWRKGFRPVASNIAFVVGVDVDEEDIVS